MPTSRFPVNAMNARSTPRNLGIVPFSFRVVFRSTKKSAAAFSNDVPHRDDGSSPTAATAATAALARAIPSTMPLASSCVPKRSASLLLAKVFDRPEPCLPYLRQPYDASVAACSLLNACHAFLPLVVIALCAFHRLATDEFRMPSRRMDREPLQALVATIAGRKVTADIQGVVFFRANGPSTASF